MIDQISRVNDLVKSHLKKVALGEPVGFMVAYGFAPLQMPDGSMELHPAWTITVTLRAALLGQPDIAFPAIIPAPMQMPPDKAFTGSAEAALEAARQIRDASLSMVEAK